MSQYKKLFSHAAIYGIAPQVTKVANFIAIPIVTKHLTATDYGIAGTLTAYTTSISVLASLGIRTVLVNSYYKSPSQYKWAWRQLYGFLRLWSLLYASLVFLLMWFAMPPEAENQKWLLLSLNLIPTLFLGNTAVFAATYYQVSQQPKQIVWRTVLFGLLTITLNVFFIAYLKLGFLGWSLATFISGIISNITYWYALVYKLKITPIFNFKWRLIKANLKISLPTIPHFYSGYLLDTSDRVVMDWVSVTTADIGKYNAAYSIANMFKTFGNAAGTAIGPLMYEGFQKKDFTTPRNLVFVLQGAFLVASFFISIWLKEVYGLMIRNTELAAMYPLGIILLMSYNYRPMYFGVMAQFQFTEFTNKTWQITLAAGVLNVVLNFIFIPLYGFEAAAYTTFVALMYMGFAGYFSHVFRKINRVSYYPLLWLLLIVLCTIVAKYAVLLPIFYKSILSFVLLILLSSLIYFLKQLKKKVKVGHES